MVVDPGAEPGPLRGDSGREVDEIEAEETFEEEEEEKADGVRGATDADAI